MFDTNNIAVNCGEIITFSICIEGRNFAANNFESAAY